MIFSTFFHKLGSPPHYYRIAGKLTPWLGISCLLLMLAGLYGGLILAPTDYQQGESYRIIYIHVPAAWMSMFIYMYMAFMAGISLIWRIKITEILAASSAPIGAAFTFLALVTGSLWGKPTWGTYWQWDGRMTSELVLLFIYFGIIGLQYAYEDQRTGAKAAAILTLVGVVNIPIIHFSVEWWNTLHQGASITKFDKPSIHISMLVPLLMMAFAFKLFFFTHLLMRSRNLVLAREQKSSWVQKMLEDKPHG